VGSWVGSERHGKRRQWSECPQDQRRFEQHRLAPLFRHGERFYNFHRLRDFKEKFDPVWESAYLAASAASWGARLLT